MCPLEAYLITDERIARHAAKYAHGRPQLAVGGPDTPLTAPGSPQTARAIGLIWPRWAGSRVVGRLLRARLDGAPSPI